MLLRGEINLRDHTILENFAYFLQRIRFFNLPPQPLDAVGTSQRGDNIGNVHNWHQLSQIQAGFKRVSEEVNVQMMDLAQDVPRRYDIAVVKKGIEILEGM
jgi:hypothetical protein